MALTTDQRRLLLWFYQETEEVHDLWQSHSAKPLYVLLCICKYLRDTEIVPPGFSVDTLAEVQADTSEDWTWISQKDRTEQIPDFLVNGPHAWHCNPANPTFDKVHTLYRHFNDSRSL